MSVGDRNEADQFEGLAKHLLPLSLPFSLFLVLALSRPLDDWIKVGTYGSVGVISGVSMIVLARRNAKSRGLPLDAPLNKSPNRWALLETLGWWIAFGSFAAPIVFMVLGPHVIKPR